MHMSCCRATCMQSTPLREREKRAGTRGEDRLARGAPWRNPKHDRAHCSHMCVCGPAEQLHDARKPGGLSWRVGRLAWPRRWARPPGGAPQALGAGLRRVGLLLLTHLGRGAGRAAAADRPAIGNGLMAGRAEARTPGRARQPCSRVISLRLAFEHPLRRPAGLFWARARRE